MNNSRRRIPVNSRRRRGITLERFMYAAARVVLYTVALIGIGLIVVKATHPYRLRHSEGQQLTEDRARCEALKADNERIRRRIEFVKTEQGKEALLLQQGYVHTNAHPIRTKESKQLPPSQ